MRMLLEGSCYQMCGTSGLSTIVVGAGVNADGMTGSAPPGIGSVGSAGVVSHGGTIPGFCVLKALNGSIGRIVIGGMFMVCGTCIVLRVMRRGCWSRRLKSSMTEYFQVFKPISRNIWRFFPIFRPKKEHSC